MSTITENDNETRIVLNARESNQLRRMLSKMRAAEGDPVMIPITDKPATRSGARVATLTKQEKPKDKAEYLHQLWSAAQAAAPASTYVKADASAAKKESALVSQELSEVNDPWATNTDNIIKPPYPLETLASLLTVNVMHQTCVEAKARDMASNGYEIVKAPGAEGISDELFTAASADAEHFLSMCTYGRVWKNAPVDVLLHALALDCESLGCAGFEVLRSPDGLVAALNHIPFATCRVTRPEFETKTRLQILQIKGQAKIGFMAFGEKVKYSGGDFDPSSAEISDFPSLDNRSTFVSYADDFPDPRYFEKITKDFRKGANEFVMIARPPFIASQTYGTPAGLTAIAYMIAQLKIDEYNVQFFSSKGVPQYAVIFEGMEMPAKDTIETEDEEETSDPFIELETHLNEFFSEKLMSAERSVVVVTTFGQSKAKFQKLSDDQVDAAFENYEKRAQEMIRLSHNTPGAAIGILDTANLGSGRDSIQMRRYYNHTILPGQRLLESAINHVLRVGRLNPWVQIKLKPLDFEDRERAEDIALKRYESGAMNTDEYRDTFGYPELPEGEGGKEHIIRQAGVTYINPSVNTAASLINSMQAKSMAKLALLREVVTTEEDKPASP